ncbi:MAG: GNAT family N-acetyltransferase [Oscillospiraceae bacterium]|jgi:predicted acetyltransferase|nr:GNAT family N-acetyltransferase [Oscillospiraceae bacterium]
MREIRRLKQSEITEAKKIDAISFNMRSDFSNPQEEKYPAPADWRWGAFEGGKLAASMMEIPYIMRFDGHDVKMSGIGSVATLPEFRRSGSVRAIFGRLIPEAYAGGAVFSCLYPFSHAYYRQFGYELSATETEARIPALSIGLKMHGHFSPAAQADIPVLRKIHDSYIKNINHAIRRDELMWKQFLNFDSYRDGVFAYVWRNESGEPRSYIKYRHIPENGENLMQASELIFIDTEGLYGALSLVGGVSAQYSVFNWRYMPDFINIFDLPCNPYDMDQSVRKCFMTRLINAKKALELMRKPRGGGRFAISIISDSLITENNNTFALEFDSGESRVSISKENPDIICDIQTAAQLITGFRSLDNALLSRRKGLEVRGRLETLREVFTERPQHFTEAF